MRERVADILIVASALLAWAFVILYAARFRWWASEMGRNVMALMSLLGAVLTLALVRIEAGDAPWFAWLRMAVFAGVPVVLAWRFWMLARIVLRRRSNVAAADESEEVD